jgi:hypothetical protein
MITAILMDQAKSEGGALPHRESEEPIVAVKQPAEDLHGDMRRGENGLKAPRRAKAGRRWRRRGERESDSEPMRSQRTGG